MPSCTVPHPPDPGGQRLPSPGSSPWGQLAAPRRTRHKADQSRRRGGGGRPARASLPLVASSCPLVRTRATPRPAPTARPFLPPPQKKITAQTLRPLSRPDPPLGSPRRRRPWKRETDIPSGSAPPLPCTRLFSQPPKFRESPAGLQRSRHQDPRLSRSRQLRPREDGEEEPPPPPPAAAALPGGRPGL